MRGKKTDNVQAEIVAALRKMGASVHDLSGVGKGCPDLLVGYHAQTFLLECKAPTGKLTPMQEQFFALWRGSDIIVARSAEDAVKQILKAV
jgi:Holliday junction resolvase